MKTEDLLQQIRRLLDAARNQDLAIGNYAQTAEFLRAYGGEGNAFSKMLDRYDVQNHRNEYVTVGLIRTLQGFYDYVEAGLHAEISPERKAQLDVVSDFLEMANTLLNNKDVHPAAAAVLIGATLEEFLRTWIEAEGLSLGNKKPGMENYSQVLRDADLITKQDGKDITSWAGIRNHAAHGEWDEVSDKARIRLMLEAVNLFMRKYS